MGTTEATDFAIRCGQEYLELHDIWLPDDKLRDLFRVMSAALLGPPVSVPIFRGAGNYLRLQQFKDGI